MGFWSRLFGFLGGRREEARASTDAAPLLQKQTPLYAQGTKIAYDPQLIERLLDDHRRVVGIFTEVRQSFVGGDTPRAAALLEQFKSGIQEHLITEEIKLYVYLQSALAGDQMNRTLMRHMHHEMSLISQDVLNFLGKYSALGKTPALNETFLDDLDKVGVVLTERIQHEETMLYPLYMSPSALESVHDDAPPG
jgi:hypothetical protein